QHHDRRIDAGAAQLHTLLDEGDAQACRSGAEGGPRDLHGAVPVAVGLDDRPHGSRRGSTPEHPHVVVDRVEVDLGVGPAVHGAAAARVPSPARTAGRWATTSLATSPCSPARRAASACNQAAATAARGAVSPRASSAPRMPASTSPVPAVANRWSPFVMNHVGSPGAATSVVGPFNSTVAPVS